MAITQPFSENPLIASLGSAIGLGPVFGAAQAAIPKGVSKPTMRPNAERPLMPPRTGGVTPGGVTQVGATPGVMDETTLQNPEVRQLLGHFGVTPSDTPPNPNSFITNPEAFERHPVASGLIERGLEGLANYQPGRDAAETIHNVVGSVVGANAMRANNVNNQLQAPFIQAHQIAQLQQAALAQKEGQSTIDYRAGMLAHAQNQDDIKEAWNQDHARLVQEATDARADAASAKLDPGIEGKRKFYKATTDQLIAKYGSEDKIPPEELLKQNSAWETSLSEAKGTSAREVAHIHASAAIQNARTRAANGGGGLAQTKLQIAEVKRRAQNTEKLVNSMDQWSPGKGVYVDPTTNKSYIPGSASWKKRYSELTGHQKIYSDKLKDLTKLDDLDDDSQSRVDGVFNAATGQVEYH